MKKVIVAAVLLLLVAGAVFRVYSMRAQAQEEREGIESIQEREGFPVRITGVESGRFEAWRELHGKIEGSRQEEVATNDAARISSIEYKIGDEVPADKPVVKLDKKDPRSMAKTDLLKKVYDEAAGDYRSYNRVYDAGGVSKDVVEKMRLNMEQAKSNYEQSLSLTEITSPISGVLTEMYARAGEDSKPGRTLFIVSALDEVRIVAHVSDYDVEMIETGQDVRVFGPGGDELPGEVVRVSMGASPKTGLFDVEMLVSNPGRALRVGVYATTEVKYYDQDGVLWVPSTSLMSDAEGAYYLWQVKDAKAVKTPVDILVQTDDHAVVTGLDPDLPVVYNGQEQLREGARVRVIQDKKPRDEKAPPADEPEGDDGGAEAPEDGSTLEGGE